MQADITIGPDGEITIITREGTYQGGTEKITALLEAFKSQGVNIEDIKVEQHRHDDEQIHIHQGVYTDA